MRVLLSVPSYSPLVAYILGTYIQNPNDTNDDIVGISWVTFDSTSGTDGLATPRLFVGVADLGADSVFVSNDAGATCEATLQHLEVYLLTSHRERYPWPANSVHLAQGRSLPFRSRAIEALIRPH